MKKRKRGIDDIYDPIPDQMYHQISQMKEPYRSLTAFLYLTGNRISEVVGIPYIEIQGKNRISEQGRDLKQFIVEPLKNWDVGWEKQGKILRVYAKTLKRKGRPQHWYVCRLDLPEETRYWEWVQKHLETIGDDDYLWNISRYKAWWYINKHTRLMPHKLRALRATRDASYFEMDSIELKKKFNWSSTEMAFKYASKGTHDIEAKLLRKALPQN